MTPAAASDWVSAVLENRALPLAGGRSAEEVAARLIEKAADRSERPLTRAEAQRIHDYLAVVGTPADAIATMRRMKHGRSFDTALDRLARLIDRMDEQAIATGELVFAATFGRDLEYYTGFVFQIEALTQNEGVQAGVHPAGQRQQLIVRQVV